MRYIFPLGGRRVLMKDSVCVRGADCDWVGKGQQTCGSGRPYGAEEGTKLAASKSTL